MSTTLILPERVQKAAAEQVEKARPIKNKSFGAVGNAPWTLANSGLRLRSQSPKQASWRQYYRMYESHAIVRAAIDKIAKTATATGFRYVSRDGRSEVLPEEVKLLEDFFDAQPNFLGQLRRIYKDLMIGGDGYLYVVPTKAGKPSILKRLPPDTMVVQADKSGTVQRYYQINPNNLSDDPVPYKPNEILHFMIDDPGNDLYGISPLESLRIPVSTDLYAQRYNAAFFRNSGMTGTIIAIKSTNTDDVSRNKQWLEQNYFGPDAAHKPIIIEGELDVTVHKAVTTQEDMGFLQGREFIRAEILAVLDVPPSKLGFVESANRANSKEQDKSFRHESIRALQALVEGVINEHLVMGILGIRKTIIRHTESDNTDKIELMEYYTRGESFGIYSPNEVREELGKPPIDGGDVHFISTPTGAIPLESMHRYFQMPRDNSDTMIDTQPSTKKPVNTGDNFIAPVTKERLEAVAQDIGLYMDQRHDGALYSAYARLREMNPEEANTLKKALVTNDEDQRLGYIYQSLSHIQGEMNNVIKLSIGDADSEVV